METMVTYRTSFACLITCTITICLWGCSRTQKEQIPRVALTDIRDTVLPHCNHFQSQPVVGVQFKGAEKGKQAGVRDKKEFAMQVLDFQFIFTPIGELLHESVKPALEVSSCPLPQTVEVDFGEGEARHFILEPPDKGFLEHPMAVQVSHDLSEHFEVQVCLPAGASLQHSLFLDGNALVREREGSHCFLLPNADLLDPNSAQGDLFGFFEQNRSVLTPTVPGFGGALFSQRIALVTACKNTFDSMEALTCEDGIVDAFGRRCMQDMEQAPLGKAIRWSTCNLLHRIAASQCRLSEGKNQTPRQIAAELIPLLSKECEKLPLLFSGLFL
ncbi:MAG: hypothetical protein AAF320_05575 [Myxococcota bacterium]